MRYYLQRTDGSRITFETNNYVANSDVLVTDMRSGLEMKFARVDARKMWTTEVRAGAFRAECVDEDGHDGEACTCKEGGDEPGQRMSAYEPEPGTYAFTARLLAQAGFMSGDEADEWKDRMKDESMGVY